MNLELGPAHAGTLTPRYTPGIAGTDAIRGRRPRGLLRATCVGLALLVAACSGSAASSNGVATLPSASAGSTPSASATPTASAGNGYDQALAYSQCMRAHGIADFPDPQSGPGGGFSLRLNGGQGSDLNPDNAQFQAAQQACQHLMPTPPPGQEGKPSQQMQQQALKFSQCMRAHGVTNFPDPQFINGGMQLKISPSSGIDPNSPTFKAAQQACQSLLPGVSGPSTNSSPGGANGSPSAPGGSTQP